MRRYKICEERGSGLRKAGESIELFQLPPIEFTADANSFKVTLHAPKAFSAMSTKERLQACYQHAVLKFYADDYMTNTSLRKRLKMPEKQRSMVSVLISQAVAKGLIKAADADNSSKKFGKYVPNWS